MENAKKYFLGLDIGTESCGWAVTDLNYNLMKAKGKHLWGVRLFDEAVDASERRGKRASRRRLVRRKLKLMWLQEIFEKEIGKVDPHFLSRMKYSSLWEEDKEKMDIALNSKDSLFSDLKDGESFRDADYYEDYKTIYHLRRELLENPAKDVRFLYLALHNIIKRRGHFLLEGEMNEDGKGESVLDLLNRLIGYIEENKEEMFAKDKTIFVNISPITEDQENDIIKLIQAKDKNVTTKKKEFAACLNIVKNDAWKNISDALINGKIDVKKVFKIESKEEIKAKSFDDENYETIVLGELENILSEEQMTILAMIRKIYSSLQLQRLLNGKDYICEAMVDRFEQHEEQLKEFKNFIKTYIPSQYNRMFRDYSNDKKKGEHNEANYCFYVRLNKIAGKKKVLNLASGKPGESLQERFYKFVKKVLEEKVEVENYDIEKYELQKQKFLDLIESGNFLPKLRTRENAVFPNQLYKKEVKKILETNKEKYSFLNEIDESGLSNIDKILKILEFRIPYYVGPLGGTGESKNSWSNRDKSFDIKPWNLDKMVDLNSAEDEFIKRMLNNCTYITAAKNETDGKVLPKNSLLYSKFRVLNELNNLKINAEPIEIAEKQAIFNGLFCNKKKVTTKELKNFLVNEGFRPHAEVDSMVITGIDKEFANNYAPYIEFKNIFGEKFVEQNQSMIDKIISYITIISDKTRLVERIKREFGEKVSDEQLKKIKGLNYAGWGRLSELFLQNMVFENKKTKEKTTIINELWNTNRNLQEILFNSDYNVQDVLKDYQKQVEGDITYALVEESYCSPAVKRAVWQTLLIIREIRDTLGGMPEKIFVEVTRKEGQKNRTKSRKNNLLALYQSKDFKASTTNMAADVEKLLQKLNNDDDLKLRSDKYYLYYMQLGKDVYTGDSIPMDEFDNGLVNYEIDHIIPQSFIKDDSLNNRVLTHKDNNQKKKNIFPCCDAFADEFTKAKWFAKVKVLWQVLLKTKLISQEKFDRLSREKPLSQEESGAFIARQLVETSQAATSVLDVLKNLYEDPRNLVYSKAHYVSEFRQIHDIVKARDVNDLHHAKDAYLNIVVGNILHNHFTNDPRQYYKNKYAERALTEEERNERLQEKSDLITKILKNKAWSYLTGEVVWDRKRDLSRIRKICNYNDVLISQKTEQNLNGAYYDETVYKKNGDGKLIPLKGDKNNPLSNVERYGGYNSMKGAYFMVMESEDKKGNKIKTIETLPTMIYQKYKNDADREQKYLDYIIEENKLKNAKLLTKLNYKSTLKIGKGMFLLTGKTGGMFILSNFNQWFVDNETQKYIKAIKKYIDLKAKNQIERLEEKGGKVVLSRPKTDDELFNKQKEIALTREENENLYKQIIEQLNKPFYENTTFVGTIQKSLKEKEEMFKTLSVKVQAEVLYNLVKKLHRGVATIDLTLLNLDKTMGKLYLSKNITDKDIKLIITSPTGLYKRSIKL